MWDDIQGWFGSLGGGLTPDVRGLWEDIRSGKLDWEQLSPEQQQVIGDAVIGQAGVEGNQALRETITPNLAEEIAAARIPGPTPLEEKAAYMEGRGGYDAAVTAMNSPAKEEAEEEPDLLNRLFLMSLMENMQGGDIGQAPAVVAGGGRREFPTMMRQFAPWEREKPYWWLR